MFVLVLFFFFKQKTAYEMRISDCSSDGALPIYLPVLIVFLSTLIHGNGLVWNAAKRLKNWCAYVTRTRDPRITNRSEEHTSELQSLMRIPYAVFCLKKKKINMSKIANKNINYHVMIHNHI